MKKNKKKKKQLKKALGGLNQSMRWALIGLALEYDIRPKLRDKHQYLLWTPSGIVQAIPADAINQLYAKGYIKVNTEKTGLELTKRGEFLVKEYLARKQLDIKFPESNIDPLIV